MTEEGDSLSDACISELLRPEVRRVGNHSRNATEQEATAGDRGNLHSPEAAELCHSLREPWEEFGLCRRQAEDKEGTSHEVFYHSDRTEEQGVQEGHRKRGRDRVGEDNALLCSPAGAAERHNDRAQEREDRVCNHRSLCLCSRAAQEDIHDNREGAKALFCNPEQEADSHIESHEAAVRREEAARRNLAHDPLEAHHVCGVEDLGPR